MPEILIGPRNCHFKGPLYRSLISFFALIMIYGCTQKLPQQAEGNGASTPDEIGFQLYTSLKKNNFSSLVYYTPDSQAIIKYYQLETETKDRDTKRNIWHYGQHITETLQEEFRQARTTASSKAINWEDVELDSVSVIQPDESPRHADVNVVMSSIDQSYHFQAKCLRINERWFIGDKIRFVKTYER